MAPDNEPSTGSQRTIEVSFDHSGTGTVMVSKEVWERLNESAADPKERGKLLEEAIRQYIDL